MKTRYLQVSLLFRFTDNFVKLALVAVVTFINIQSDVNMQVHQEMRKPVTMQKPFLSHPLKTISIQYNERHFKTSLSTS